jgi:hypothetical protein
MESPQSGLKIPGESLISKEAFAQALFSENLSEIVREALYA